MSEPQSIDPEVSRAKFAREIGDFRKLAATYRKRGIFLIEADFPKARVLFAARKLKGVTPIVAAADIDFTDYDLKPPSVTFVDPFTGEPIKAKDLRMQMLRAPTIPGASLETVQTLIQQGQVQPQLITISHGPEDKPFICLPGIREYHDNPAHTGDSWLLHRTSGAGCLAFILDKMWTYGADQIADLQIQLTPTVTGFGYRVLQA